MAIYYLYMYICTCMIWNQTEQSLLLFQAKDSRKSIFEVLNWYDGINSYLMDFISFSIRVKTSEFAKIHISSSYGFNIEVVQIVYDWLQESEVGLFYRYILSLKNLLRSIEACGKAGVFGLRYLSQGKLEKKYFYRFVRNEMLRREYLNQTFLVLPEMQVDYNKIVHDADFEKAQMEIFSLKGEDLSDNDDGNGKYSNGNSRKKSNMMSIFLIIDKM